MDAMPAVNQCKINDQEVFKIKIALSSLTNTVIVCPAYATLYTQSPTDDETWSYCKRGAPGILLSHNINRDITGAQLCIADPESGFAVWRETLYEKSNYKATQKNFHTFKLLSGGTDCMAGIRFPSDESACRFLQEVLFSIPKGDPRPESPINSEKASRKSMRKIRKDEISTPCMFKHVTSSTVSNKHRERSKKERSKSTKGKKYSGSGSSLDAPDADPMQDLATRRTLNSYS